MCEGNVGTKVRWAAAAGNAMRLDAPRDRAALATARGKPGGPIENACRALQIYLPRGQSREVEIERDVADRTPGRTSESCAAEGAGQPRSWEIGRASRVDKRIPRGWATERTRPGEGGGGRRPCQGSQQIALPGEVGCLKGQRSVAAGWTAEYWRVLRQLL